MSNAAFKTTPSVEAPDGGEIVRRGREIMLAEAESVVAVAEQLDERFSAAVSIILASGGDLIVVGMGKAGHVGRKLAATFASTGTRAHFLHPAEAFHGDLGRVRPIDVTLVLSQSGETGEVLQLLPPFQAAGVPIIAVTANAASSLGRAARVVLPIGQLKEACWLGLAPSTSTTVMLALGDALALTLSRLRGFTDEQFARYHPGGSLGLKLSVVDDHMRPLAECRTANSEHTVRQVLIESTKPGRRSGAVILTDDAGRLAGLFTDSDLARLIEHRREAALDRPIYEFMTRTPATIATGQRVDAAIELLAACKFSELPVVDVDGKPVGLIDVTDVVGIQPRVTGGRSVRADRPSVRLFAGDESTSAAEATREVELPPTD